MVILTLGDERGLLAALSLDDKVRLLTGADNWRTCPLPAIGLRAMVVSDGPAGVRGITMDERNPAASLPCPSALGATWDPALVQALAAALGAEARSKGVDVLLAPTINVMRTPLGGRGFESFGEDPVLIARIAVAFVRGLHQAGAAAAVKHYVGNDSETGRWTYDARIAEHVLRELYLVPFEACVREADVDLVMTGYNKVNGTTMTEHGPLLGRILKEEWGFGGVALSDWHAARSTVATAVAGLDLAMPGPDGPWGGQLVEAVRAGQVSEDAVDAKVLRILRLARRVGAIGDAPTQIASPADALDDRDPSTPNGAPNGRAPVLADPALLRRVAAAAFTLLRNEGGVLPLDLGTIRSLAVIGPNAVSPVTQGGGSATVPQVSVSTPAAALTEALAGLDPETQVTVRPGCVTWNIVPEPPRSALRDPDTGEPGVRIEFRTEDGALAAAEHRTATMFTWWDGLPEGVGRGGLGTIVLRTRYLATCDGPHVIGAGGVGRLALTVNGIEVAAGHTDVPADPVEAMVRPGEIRATVYLAAGREAEIADLFAAGRLAAGPGGHPAGPGARAGRRHDAQPGRRGRARRRRRRAGGRLRARQRERGVRPPRARPARQAGRTGTPGRGGERPDDRGGERRDAGAHAVGGPGGGGRLRLAAGPGDGHRAGRRTARPGRTGRPAAGHAPGRRGRLPRPALGARRGQAGIPGGAADRLPRV